ANKVPGVRAALCHDTYTAKLTRLHNDANILCFGERVVGKGVIEDMIEAFINTEFEGGRHAGRVEKIESCSMGADLG
ncbi:MAG: RpiB/LacA/LacB family sugar-phosphate isomerase, partial [Sulfurovum sp.]|nr:RpiB/LacA/LacB family sugar-phosphate isomerase [Sulfurovum sp.]